MSSSTSEEKKNPVVTLKTQAEECNFSILRARKDDTEATSGYQAYKGINRMNFVIDGKVVSGDLITKLYKEYNSLLPKSEDESKDYRPFARAVFKKMFEHNKTGSR
ncbi:MAG: hypothetical protein LBU56_04470 [Rickettsiales bacterium]|jgi:hypothetical protein|nr:hypothetical protein [Rickettsiales bacterium]